MSSRVRAAPARGSDGRARSGPSPAVPPRRGGGPAGSAPPRLRTAPRPHPGSPRARHRTAHRRCPRPAARPSRRRGRSPRSGRSSSARWPARARRHPSASCSRRHERRPLVPGMPPGPNPAAAVGRGLPGARLVRWKLATPRVRSCPSEAGVHVHGDPALAVLARRSCARPGGPAPPRDRPCAGTWRGSRRACASRSRSRRRCCRRTTRRSPVTAAAGPRHPHRQHRDPLPTVR